MLILTFIRERSIAAVWFALLLLWLSLFFSYQIIQQPMIDYRQSYAIGGYPLTSFYYPVPPMGSDRIPPGMLRDFGYNALFWLLIGSIVALLVPRRVLNKRLLKFARRTGIALTMLGFLYLMVKFD